MLALVDLHSQFVIIDYQAIGLLEHIPCLVRAQKAQDVAALSSLSVLISIDPLESTESVVEKLETPLCREAWRHPSNEKLPKQFGGLILLL